MGSVKTPRFYALLKKTIPTPTLPLKGRENKSDLPYFYPRNNFHRWHDIC